MTDREHYALHQRPGCPRCLRAFRVIVGADPPRPELVLLPPVKRRGEGRAA